MSNKKKREDWPKRYGRGERFSDETVAKIKDGFIARRKQVDVAREYTYRVAARMQAGKPAVQEVSMAKNFATEVADKVTYEAVQIFGGMGYMRESVVERLYRDNRILSIGGGTHEIMNEIIAKQLNL